MEQDLQEAKSTRKPRFRLGALAGRLAIAVFLVREFYVLTVVSRMVPARHRFWVFLFHPKATPKSVRYAFLIALVAAILGELLSLIVLRPILRVWLSPRLDESIGLFRLAASEWVVDQSPARRRLRPWVWDRGTLVRTNQRIWFFPETWDAEPLSFHPDQIGIVNREPAPRLVFGLIEGVPDRLRVVSCDTEEVTFAVKDPGTVLTWFRPELISQATGQTPEAA